MPNHKSAEKRDRQRQRRRLANRTILGRTRTAIKNARDAVDGKKADAAKLVAEAVSFIDKAVSKGVLKRNTGSRYVSRLIRRVSQAAS